MSTFIKSQAAKVAIGLLALVAFAVAGSAQAYTFNFVNNLKMGQSSSDIKELQKALNANGFVVATSGAGSPGSESNYFGAKTKAAVQAFQTAKSISPVSGYVGPLTRGALNALGGTPGTSLPAGCTSTSGFSPISGVSCATGQSSGSQTGPVTASLAASNPASMYLVSGQALADLAQFTFSGTGTVSSVTLTRGGISDQSTLTNVYLYDGATRLTDGYSFNNTGSITMNNVNLMVSGSKTISVKADVLSTATGTVSVGLSSFTAGTVVTPVSLSGNMMSIANGVGILGTVNLTVASPSPTAATVNAGSMNQNLWSNTVSVGVHASKLYGMTVRMIGSAPANTLANVGLFVDGVKVGSASINGMNQFVFDLSATPLNLTTGSHVVDVRGDVVGGAYRNFYLSLEKAADLSIKDGQVNGGGVVSIAPTYLTNPLNNVLGGLVTINNGTLTINQDTSFNNTTTLVGGATSVKMAAYKFTAYGEDVKVNSLTFTPTLTLTTPASPDSLINVGLYVNGGQVGSNATATTATPLTFNNLGSNLIVPVGMPVTVEIRGDVINGGNVTVTAGTVKFDLASGSSNAQGVTSGQLTSTASAGGQSLTVSSSNVSFAQTSGWAASSVAPNQSAKKIGSFTLSTASAEGVTINNILVGITGTMITANQVTNLTVKDASTGLVLGTPVGNPTASNNFSTSLPVPISSTKTLDVYADIGSGSAGLTVIPTMTITYRGMTSMVTTTSSAVTGSTITANVATIIAGEVTFVPSSSLVSQFLIGGQSATVVGTFNVKSNNSVGGAVIKDVTVTVPANTIGSVTLNGVTGQIVGTTATLYNVGVTVPADASGINIPMTVSLVCVNASGGCAGISNSSVTAQITTLTYFDGSATQSISPTAITATHKLVATKPVVSMTSSSGSGFLSGNIKIGEFTVSADAAGDLKLEQIPITVTISGAAAITAGTVELRDSTGNTVIVGTGGVNGSAGLNGSGNFVFNTSSRVITHGTSETFTVYATFTGVTGGSNTMNETFGLGAKASFLWTDVIGNVTGITGAYLNTYPSATQTKSN